MHNISLGRAREGGKRHLNIVQLFFNIQNIRSSSLNLLITRNESSDKNKKLMKKQIKDLIFKIYIAFPKEKLNTYFCMYLHNTYILMKWTVRIHGFL